MAIEALDFEFANSSSDIRNEIQVNGYANLPFGLGRAACSELFSNFKGFVDLCSEPGGEKLSEALKFDVNGKGNGEYSLDLRRPGEMSFGQRSAGTDHKYVLHYGPQTVERAKSALGALPAQMEELLDACGEFYLQGRKTATDGAAALGIKSILFPKAGIGQEVHLLRLIDYIGSEEKQLAKPHFDRGVVTLAISESAPGLTGAPADNGFSDGVFKPLSEETKNFLKNSLQPVDHYEGIAKFFPAAGLRRLPEWVRHNNKHDELPIFAHDVLNQNPGENRQAVVMFFNPHLEFNNYTVPTADETSIDH